MIAAILIILVILAVAGVVAVGRSLKVVQQFEQGIVFRFGKIQSPPRGAGLTVIRPVGDRMQKVNMQIVAMAVPAQDGITKDNVTVRVDAVVYFRVVDPDQGHSERAELPVRGLAAGADLAAVDHRPVRDGPAAVGAGRGQPRAAPDHR